MEFCPTCGSMLLIELPRDGRGTRFYCTTCPYICPIERGIKIKRKQPLVRKGIDLVISYSDLNNAPKDNVTCPNCGHPKAAVKEVQDRSGDEGSTVFYKCLNEKCKHQWKGT